MAEAYLTENLRRNRQNALFGSISNNMLQPFISRLAIQFGATDPQLGALSSLGHVLSLLFMVPGSLWLGRTRHRRQVLAGFFLLSKLFMLGIAASTLAAPGRRVWLLILMWGLYNLPLAAANTGLSGLIADLMPAEWRGRAFAERNRVAALVGTGVVLVAGFLLDRLPEPAGFVGVFSAAFLFGLFEIYYLLQFKMVAVEQPTKPKLRGDLKQLFADRRYVWFLAVSFLFHFFWHMAAPAFNRYQVTYLGADNLWTSLLTVTSSLGSVFSYPWWARQAERRGNTTLLPLAAFGMALSPFWAMISPNLWVLTLTNIIVGVSVAGTTQLILNSCLDVAPPAQRNLGLTVHQLLVTVVAAVAPLLGGFVMELITARWTLGVNTLLRLTAAAAFVYYLRGPGAPVSMKAEKQSEGAGDV